MKTYTIRLFPSSEQVQQLNQLSSIRNSLWNTLIGMEQSEYDANKKIIHNYELDKHITNLRKTSDLSLLNSKACQRVSKEIYSSYQSFFKLIKKDKSARPPKLIDEAIINKYHTLIYNQSGWSINSSEVISINKIKFSYKSHLNLKDLNIREIRVKYVNDKWLCDVCIEEEKVYLKSITQENKVLAIDLGLKNLGNCVDNLGNVIVITNKAKKISKYYLNQIGKVQNKLSAKNKGSKKYKKLRVAINKLYNKKNSQVKHALHAQSKELLSMNYKTIVIGDLSVKKLMESDKSKYSKVSKSFGMSNINMFVGFLIYKSHMHQTDIVKINEAYTTQTNCLTGKQFSPKIELKDRTVKLNDDIEIDRDLNASINILERYFNNHLAVMTQPLDKSSVIQKFNLLNKPSQIGKPISL